MDLKFDNYIRLNDMGESLLCCDNVLYISRGLHYDGGLYHSINVFYACKNEPAIFEYDSIDTFMSDFENIKTKISSLKS